jgi:hypothetical protein
VEDISNDRPYSDLVEPLTEGLVGSLVGEFDEEFDEEFGAHPTAERATRKLTVFVCLPGGIITQSYDRSCNASLDTANTC